MRMQAPTRAMRVRLTSALMIVVVIGPTMAEIRELDPIVQDVVEMLRSNVDEAVILTWLETTDRRPADVGSRGVIALTEAGASEELMTALLARLEGEPGESEPGPNARPIERVAPLAEPRRSAGPDTVEAVFRTTAKRVWVDEDEPDRPRDPDWWVFVYLDGELVGWTKPSMRGEPVEARRAIAAGAHELRVILQRYEEQRGGWLYESLSVPTLVDFEARPGEPLEIEVEIVRIWGLWRHRQDGGPLRYLIRQGAEVLAENTGTGGDPNRWSPVCEDVEANFVGVEKVPKRFRNAMSRCVRWVALWTGSGQFTDRQAILDKLEEDDFEPPVR